MVDSSIDKNDESSTSTVDLRKMINAEATEPGGDLAVDGRRIGIRFDSITTDRHCLRLDDSGRARLLRTHRVLGTVPLPMTTSVALFLLIPTNGDYLTLPFWGGPYCRRYGRASLRPGSFSLETGVLLLDAMERPDGPLGAS